MFIDFFFRVVPFGSSVVIILVRVINIDAAAAASAKHVSVSMNQRQARFGMSSYQVVNK